MRNEEFLGPYRSYAIEQNGQRYYIRGHNPWVEWIFHPDRRVHEQALFMLELASKYDRRWSWWFLRVPPPLYTMQVEKVQIVAPQEGMMVRLLAWLIAFYAAWSALR